MKKRFGFTHNDKLTTQAEFKAVFNKSNRISQNSLLVLFKPNQKPHARLGLVVGKAVAKQAVSRNRIKRVLRESFRLQQKELNNLDIVVIARQQCDKLSKQKLRQGIDQLWKRLKI